MNYREKWQQDGFLVVHDALSQEQVAALYEACETTFNDWKENSSSEVEPANYAYGPGAWALLHLNHSRYYRERPHQLQALLDAIANPLALQVTREVFQAEPLFMQANYYIDPPGETRPSTWHRDSQFYTKGDEEQEKRNIQAEADPPRELHMHIPLVKTAASELVPGSHNRWDTPEENRIRREDPLSNEMPNSVVLELNPGDLAFFHVNSLHRGIYPQGVPRRTIAVTFSHPDMVRKATPEGMKDWLGYMPTYQPWVQQPGYLHGVAEPTREFFDRFIQIYGDSWKPEMLELLPPERQSYFRDI